MAKVLVTGAAGVLGRQLVVKLHAAGYATRGTSRRGRPADIPDGVEWVQADLAQGQGLAAALDGVHVIIHAASSPFRGTQQVDVEGTERLLSSAKQTGVGHAIYISIVGIEQVPYAYYQCKVLAENVVMAGGIPWTILRATQFHDLLDLFLRTFMKLPLAVVPLDFQFQLVDSGEVAGALCDCVAAGPRGRVPDMGGPKVQKSGELLRAWLAVRRMRRLVLPLPTFGKAASAFKHGYNTCPDHCQGKITWEEWLRIKYGGGKV
jgi:uncharacterized protein YbjT (DUF2867 family)